MNTNPQWVVTPREREKKVIFSKVSKEPAASFSIYAMKMTAGNASEKLVAPYRTVRYHRAGDHALNIENCVKFRAVCSRNEFSKGGNGYIT